MHWKLLLVFVPLFFFVSCYETDEEVLTMEEIQLKLNSLEQRNKELQKELDTQKKGLASKDQKLDTVLEELEVDRKELKSELDARKKAEKAAEREVKQAEDPAKTVISPAKKNPEPVGLSEIEKTSQIKLIKAFYELLEVGEIEKAYKMRVSDDVPLEAFQNWYGSITEIRPRSFEKEEIENQYSFLVDYSDDDTKNALYRVVMETVADDKIKVVASWKLEGGTVTDN